MCQSRIIYSRPIEYSAYLSERRILGALHEGLLTLAREVDGVVPREEDGSWGEIVQREVVERERFGEWGGPRRGFGGGEM